jgi:hypothetical protein
VSSIFPLEPKEQNMNIHAIQTGSVAVKESQLNGGDRHRRSLLRVMADSRWTEPLPIYAWLIEHREGLIVVDTGETARVSEPGYFPAGIPTSAWPCASGSRPSRRSVANCTLWGSHPATFGG